MNKFEIIPIEKLRRHPDNPRRATGDLDMVKESIGISGIKRNLVVVPATGYDYGCYWVIYGDIIFEAAKEMGFKNLPCVINDTMTIKEQIEALIWM